MSDRAQKLRWLARRCFGLSLAALIVIAVLTSAAFYLSALDNWALIRPIGPMVVTGAAFVGFTFLLGLLAHAVSVFAYGSSSPQRIRVPSRDREEPTPITEL